jgi:membrane protease YdiL (CAAX protease family)
MVKWVDDLKTALVLSSAFALAAAATVPLLLPSLPEEAQSLPLPLPVFCVVLAVQMAGVYGLLGFAGLRLARRRELEPAPYLTRLWDRQRAGQPASLAAGAFAFGMLCGVVLVGVVAAVQQVFPGTLPAILHPPGIAAALLASMAGSFGEEILFRLFVLSLLLRLLPAGRMGTVLAVSVSALAFGAAHAPAFVFLFGGWQEVPLLSWVWLIVLNGLLGVSYGVVYLRYGVVCAILCHLGTDVVWHAASQLLRA